MYSYKHSLSGFAATLNASQAAILTSKQSTLARFLHCDGHICGLIFAKNGVADTRGVISVFKSRMMKLCTTRSWDFMGLTLDYSGGTPLQLCHGEDVIVGVFDSGDKHTFFPLLCMT